MYRYKSAIIRANYQCRDKYLQSTSNINTERMIWGDAYAQADVSVSLSLNPYAEIALSANNLLDNARRDSMGIHRYDDGFVDTNMYQRSWAKSDRRYALILRGQF